MIYNRIQLYNENALIKYPLSDTHTEDIPNDIILDLSLTVPANLTDIKCTNIICKPNYVFISFESANGPVGHVITLTPKPFIIIPLTMSCAGYGWIVLGPGALRAFELKGSTVAVDSRCIVPNISTLKKFKLNINGFEYDMPKALKIVCNANTKLLKETRVIGSTATETLTIARNDLILGDTVLKTGLIQFNPEQLPISTIANVRPDANGNIDILFTAETATEHIYFIPAYSVNNDFIGFLIVTEGMQGCVDPYRILTGQIRKSDTGYGSAEAMPLDCLFPPTPESPSPTYPCPDSY